VSTDRHATCDIKTAGRISNDKEDPHDKTDPGRVSFRNTKDLTMQEIRQGAQAFFTRMAKK
jgi:hypothetical protein